MWHSVGGRRSWLLFREEKSRVTSAGQPTPPRHGSKCQCLEAPKSVKHRAGESELWPTITKGAPASAHASPHASVHESARKSWLSLCYNPIQRLPPECSCECSRGCPRKCTRSGLVVCHLLCSLPTKGPFRTENALRIFEALFALESIFYALSFFKGPPEKLWNKHKNSLKRCFFFLSFFCLARLFQKIASKDFRVPCTSNP